LAEALDGCAGETDLPDIFAAGIELARRIVATAKREESGDVR
jgi:hypothetical protein